MGHFGERSPRSYNRLRSDLKAFRDVYVPYVTESVARLQRGERPEHGAKRTEVRRLAIKASHAVDLTGTTIAWLPAPVLESRHVPSGLAEVAFVHESTTYWMPELEKTTGESWELVLDAVDTADTFLAEWRERARRKRRNPLWWIDKILRSVLGLPAYIIGLVLGFDPKALPASRQRGLWLLSIAADVGTLWGVGHVLKWW